MQKLQQFERGAPNAQNWERQVKCRRSRRWVVLNPLLFPSFSKSMSATFLVFHYVQTVVAPIYWRARERTSAAKHQWCWCLANELVSRQVKRQQRGSSKLSPESVFVGGKANKRGLWRDWTGWKIAHQCFAVASSVTVRVGEEQELFFRRSWWQTAHLLTSALITTH